MVNRWGLLPCFYMQGCLRTEQTFTLLIAHFLILEISLPILSKKTSNSSLGSYCLLAMSCCAFAINIRLEMYLPFRSLKISNIQFCSFTAKRMILFSLRCQRSYSSKKRDLKCYF